MIEGLKVEVAGTELRGLCQERAKHHLERMEFYVAQIRSLHDGGVERTHVSGDPVRDLQERVKTHEARGRYFTFVGLHIVADETYRLAQTDLRDLEITDRY